MTLSPRRSEADSSPDILQAGVAGLAPAYLAGRLDPVGVAAFYLARIEQRDSEIGAFVDLDQAGAAAAAAASARRWLAGRPLSALDGVPLAIKSNIAVAGLGWTAGIGAYRHRLAPKDAACVARLRRKGAVILGTTAMDEAALGAVGDNPWFGRTRNPHAPDRISGGSSGGSAAAVAAGFCAAALGTDSFGSIRIPASYCGLFGLKPRFGAIPTNGIIPLTRDFDTVGLLARSAEDCKMMLDGLGVKADGAAPSPVIGVAGFDGNLDAIGRRLRQRLDQLGIDHVTVDWDDEPFRQAMKSALLIAEVHAARTHHDILARPDAEISAGLRSMLEWGARQTADRVSAAKARIAQSKAALLQRIAQIDQVLTPATPTVAPRFEQADDRMVARFTFAASLSGLPALAVPLGCDDDDLPCSVQIIGNNIHRMIELGSRLAIWPPLN